MTATPGRLDIGRVMSGGFRIIAARPATVLLLGAAFAYLPAMASVLARRAWFESPPSAGGAIPTRWALYLLVVLADAAMSWLLYSAIAAFTAADRSGQSRTDVLSVTRRLLPRAPMIYALGLVSSFAIAGGTVLLIVPGIILALTWCVGPAIAALEDRGFVGVFRRSADLTDGHRGSIFGVFLILWLASLVLGFAMITAFGLPMTASASWPDWFALGFEPASTALLQMVSGAMVVSIYVELRGLKDGPESANMAAQFD